MSDDDDDDIDAELRQELAAMGDISQHEIEEAKRELLASETNISAWADSDEGFGNERDVANENVVEAAKGAMALLASVTDENFDADEEAVVEHPGLPPARAGRSSPPLHDSTPDGRAEEHLSAA
eukprot:CAMPEP_0113722078 /NCGR_PEP_ID=MMETSP0038_2-20120614/37523_1 /TAXON_ID=2898 /ORGANISM="Cryptomonas paramecium" /LENGTH=123 /DNA_ID=CAMNT_0000651227 /DNA_START=194 /DNA_END=562 /DNA_ORIENTATION=+ /assembly_acc=CAM_ASM_000170